MNESSPKTEKPWSEKTVEEQANCKENHFNLQLLRWKNPIIFQQIVQTMSRSYNDRTEISQRLKEKIEELAFITPIHMEKNVPKVNEKTGWRESIPSRSVLLKKNGQMFDTGVWSAIEAHEKGHALRNVESQKEQSRFLSAFDFSKCQSEKAKQIDYLKNPLELIERMSQLKNYFGFRGDEKFTIKHLEYARKHYVQDTGFDNQMTQFFQAITPEKEDAFIELINSAGI